MTDSQYLGSVLIRQNFNQKQPSEVFCKKSVLEKFAKFTGRHLRKSLFFNKVAEGLQLYSKRCSGTGVFLWTFAKFLRTSFLTEHSGGCFCLMKTTIINFNQIHDLSSRANCSPLQSLNMLPFHIRLESLKLTYNSLIPNFSRYYFKTGKHCLLFLSSFVFPALQFNSNYFGFLLWKIVKPHDP